MRPSLMTAVSAEPGPAPFTASRRLEIAEHLRVPYLVTGEPIEGGLEHLQTRSGATVFWPCPEHLAGPVVGMVEIAGMGTIPVFGQVVGDRVAERLLAGHGGSWSRAVAVTGDGGEPLGSIWRAGDGSVFLPFDPDEVCHHYWSERYLALVRGPARALAQRTLMHGYYEVRGLLPRSVQIWLRRRYAPIQARSSFPHWPAETALHDFIDLFLRILAEVGGEPIPYIAPWPDGHDWALVLTHDVETSAGVAALEPVLELERSLRLRSAWNFVPRRYQTSDTLISELATDGFEVGVHGLRHDGRDLASMGDLRQRLPAMREAAARWQAVGFRSPALHRRWEWMPLLEFDYDSSYPDTDPFEPQRGGCCSLWPFFNGSMVELPLTMPQDHTLFVILGHEDESAWVEKAEFLRHRGGMALIDTHPDYLTDDRIMQAYRRLLERYCTADSAWKALPAQVSAWWRRRAASHIEIDERKDSLTVTGPAGHEARIAFAEARPWS